MSVEGIDFSGNIERFSRFADLYHKYRPAPPPVLSSVITHWAQLSHLQLVVDLSSGTGLSMRYWADRAEQVMDPHSTFHEAARILQPGGVFAACDYDWPPTTGNRQTEAAYEACMQRVRERLRYDPGQALIQQWDKTEHLGRMQASGCFRYTKEIVLHHVDQGNAERLVGLLLSQGGVMTLLKAGFGEHRLGIDQFREIARSSLGSQPQTWYWSSRVRLGIV